MVATFVQFSNRLKWLNLNEEHQNNSPDNGAQFGMLYQIRINAFFPAPTDLLSGSGHSIKLKKIHLYTRKVIIHIYIYIIIRCREKMTLPNSRWYTVNSEGLTLIKMGVLPSSIHNKWIQHILLHLFNKCDLSIVASANIGAPYYITMRPELHTWNHVLWIQYSSTFWHICTLLISYRCRQSP